MEWIYGNEWRYDENSKKPKKPPDSLWKIDRCKNKLKKPSSIKVGEHIPCAYSMPVIWTFDGTENKHDVYKSEDCMKTFCEYLRE